MKIRFSGQAAAVVHPLPEKTPEQAYLDELTQAIEKDSEERAAARRLYLNEWTDEAWEKE